MRPPYYFVPETDSNLEVTIKRKNGRITNPHSPQEVYFMDERDAPVGVNYGFDRDLNLFHCERLGIEQNAICTIQRQMEQRNKLEIKELKAKHKAALDRKPKISKGDLKWFYDMVQKAIKHEETIIQSVNRMSEIRLECEKNHIRWTDEATRVLDKQRKSEDELAIVLHSIKEQLPILEAALAPVPKEKKCTSKK
jgi:hypothetical protein